MAAKGKCMDWRLTRPLFVDCYHNRADCVPYQAPSVKPQGLPHSPWAGGPRKQAQGYVKLLGESTSADIFGSTGFFISAHLALLPRPRHQFRDNPQKCMEMCRTLGIRFRPKSSVKSRETKYASFRNTKSKIGMKKAVEIQTRELRAQDAAPAAEE
jgi:hypothetical protein